MHRNQGFQLTAAFPTFRVFVGNRTKTFRVFCRYAFEFVSAGYGIDFAKRSIVSLYEDDLRKYDGEGFAKASAIFKSVPEQLAHHNAHFMLSTVDEGSRYESLIDSINFMSESMMVNTCVNVTSPDALLALYADRTRFKMFLGDTGLLVTQAAKSFYSADGSLRAQMPRPPEEGVVRAISRALTDILLSVDDKTAPHAKSSRARRVACRAEPPVRGTRKETTWSFSKSRTPRRC